jgi:hypothetical protein
MRKLILSFLLGLAPVAFAATDPCASSKGIDFWVDCRLRQTIMAQQTQQNPTKQTDSPAISSSSTSLVDHTSLADFATAALNVSGNGNGSAQSPSGTTSISAYALYTAIKGQNPFDAVFYNAHPGLRQVTFSVGTDTSAASKNATAATGTTSSRVVGATVLVVNRRDLARQRDKLDKLADTDAVNIAMNVGHCEQDIVDALYKAYSSSVAPAPSGQDQKVWVKLKLQELDASKTLVFIGLLEKDKSTAAVVQSILNQYAPDYQASIRNIQDTIQTIQNAFQFSISGQATIGDTQAQSSDYRGQVALEKGAGANWNFTFNGSFDYINSHQAGADTRGGRAALDLQYMLAPWTSTSAKVSSGNKKPISIDFSGESDWFESFRPSYVGQVKLNIPLSAGIDLPLSFSYASSANLLHEEHAVGKIGLTFDVSRITAALTSH